MANEKHTTLGQMKQFAQMQDARDDEQEAKLKLLGEENDGVVKYTEAQSLDDTQKAQARTNIGTASQEDVDSLSTEIAYLQSALTTEEWTFTLEDGTTVTRDVCTGALSTESWTFTLDGGTTVTKGVYVG